MAVEYAVIVNAAVEMILQMAPLAGKLKDVCSNRPKGIAADARSSCAP